MEPNQPVSRTASKPGLLHAKTDVFAKSINHDQYIECARCRQPVVGGLTEGGRRGYFDPATRVLHSVTCPNQ